MPSRKHLFSENSTSILSSVKEQKWCNSRGINHKTLEGMQSHYTLIKKNRPPQHNSGQVSQERGRSTSLRRWSPETHPPCPHPRVCVETKQVFSVLSSVFSLNPGLLLKLTESVLCLQSFLCFKKYSSKLHIQSCYFCKNSEELPTALQYSHKALYNPALNNISKHIILPSPIPTFQAHRTICCFLNMPHFTMLPCFC